MKVRLFFLLKLEYKIFVTIEINQANKFFVHVLCFRKKLQRFLFNKIHFYRFRKFYSLKVV